MPDYQNLIDEMVEVLLEADPDAPVSWTKEVLDDGMEATVFFNDVFTPAMMAVGDKFGRLEIFLPELMDSAERAQAISKEVLEPIFKAQGGDTQITRGKIVLCTVQGDLHDIGKNMVSLMLQVNGFEVVDMGINVPPRDALNKAREVNADILGLSALMTTSQPYMKECVELRDGLGLKDKFSIIVGGAPITAEYTAKIGADAFGKSAVEAVEKCKWLMDQRRASLKVD
jgi:methylmalonyl-CoA mutase cobalamin-binding domain/chain